MAISEEIIVNVIVRDRGKLLAYIRSIVQDRDLAEDVFQDISLLALNNRASIEGEQHLIRWLRRVARHRSLNALLQSRRHPVLFQDPELLDLLESAWQRYDQVPSEELIDALQRCMDDLGPHNRTVIELRYRDGLKGEQIAHRMDRKVDAVYKTVSRVHRRLLDCIRRRMNQEPLAGRTA